MGYFDLPRGDFELLMKKKGRGCYKPEWRSVMFTDRLDPESIVMTVEDWSKHYKVLAARYNGKAVTIPEKYHWEHRVKGEVLGVYESWDGVYYECSACGEPWTTIDGTPWDNGMKFCPNCGARMEDER